MNIEKGKYWNATCNPLRIKCKCEVQNCWYHALLKRHGWKYGWFPEQLKKITFRGKAKVYALNWSGDLGWGGIESRLVRGIFTWLIHNEAERLANNVPKHTFLILTKWPDVLYNYLGNYVTFQNTNIWIGTTITGINTEKDNKRLQALDKFEGFKKWVSIEPLLSPLFLGTLGFLHNFDQVIVGVDSVCKDKTFPSMIIGDVVQQCQNHSISCFVKQLHIDGKLSKNPDDWPEDLRVRELSWLKT